MLVGDEYAGEVIRRQAQTAQLDGDVARTESAIEQEAGSARFDKQGIATTAAAQRSKAHYFSWS
jgi:hypothetical protein